MVILSSEEFKAQENNRIQNGLERLINKINLQSTRGFGHDGMNPTVETSLNNNEYIGYLMINDRIAASGFGRLDDGQEGNKYKTMYLHSISVAEEFRGQGLCKQITDEFIKKFGNHILYLTVRTESGNENVSGIKCYEKNGFIMLPQVYRDHYDGKNNAMIRLPTNSKNSIRSRRRRKKTRNKRK
jgi:ribosomal protein S18 acetylase RimI-like enzyme